MEARSLMFQDSGLTGVLKVKGFGFSSGLASHQSFAKITQGSTRSFRTLKLDPEPSTLQTRP